MNEKLYRIKNADSVLGGVTLGLGRYFSVDPVIIRVLFVVLFFTPIPIFIAYVVLWIVLPESSYSLAYDGTFNQEKSNSSFQSSNFNTMSKKTSSGNLVGGIILIILGSIFAFKSFFDINLFHYIGKMWPLFLVALGVWLIIKEKDENDDFNNFNKTNSDTSNQEF